MSIAGPSLKRKTQLYKNQLLIRSKRKNGVVEHGIYDEFELDALPLNRVFTEKIANVIHIRFNSPPSNKKRLKAIVCAFIKAVSEKAENGFNNIDKINTRDRDALAQPSVSHSRDIQCRFAFRAVAHSFAIIAKSIVNVR